MVLTTSVKVDRQTPLVNLQKASHIGSFCLDVVK